MTIAPIGTTYTWSELAKLLGVETPEDKAEKVWGNVVGADYSWLTEEARRQLGEGASDDSVEAKRAELEQEAIDHECGEADERYRGAIRKVAENLFREHLLSLTEVEKEGEESHFVVEPMKNSCTGWYRAASKIIETINGVGMFELRNVRELVESGPYASIRDAVMQHAHWIASYPEVYEGTKASHLVDRQLRRR